MLKGAAGCRRVPMLCFFAGQGCGGSMKIPQTEDAGRGGVLTSLVLNKSSVRPRRVPGLSPPKVPKGAARGKT